MVTALVQFDLLSHGLSSPFEYYLVESIAANCDKNYLQTIQCYVTSSTPETFYESVKRTLKLPLFDQSIIDWELNYKFRHPRILAHYDIATSRKPGYLNSNGEIVRDFCFSESSLLKPFDRVLGDSRKPLVIYYGSHTLTSKKELARLLEKLTRDEIRLVWRYVPTHKQRERLSGFGITLKAKNTEYLAIDPNNIVSTKRKFRVPPLKMSMIEQIDALDEWFPVYDENLSYKIASYVLDSTKPLETLQHITRRLPHYAPFLSKLKTKQEVIEAASKNSQLGLGADSYGIYVNGAPIHGLEVDVVKLMETVTREYAIIDDLTGLGFNTTQAKFLISKYALMSAVKESHFATGNLILGNNENRFQVWRHKYLKYLKRGVVYFNDIETDEMYAEFTIDQDIYLQPGEHIPLLKENIHDVVVFINMGDKSQLRAFFVIAKLILDNGIPQQVGLVALPGDDRDGIVASKFYHIVSQGTAKQEALAFLYKYMEATTDEESNQVLDLIPDDPDFDPEVYAHTARAFSVNEPLLAVNGVFMSLSSNWKAGMGKQVSQDVHIIRDRLRLGIAVEQPLRTVLYDRAKKERNSRVIPEDPSKVIYKHVDKELVDSLLLISRERGGQNQAGSFWLVGDFHHPSLISQLIEIIKLVESDGVIVHIIDTGGCFENEFKSQYNLASLTKGEIERLKAHLVDWKPKGAGLRYYGKILERKQLPMHHDFMLYNARYFRLSSPALTHGELKYLIDYENGQRLSILPEIFNAYPPLFESLNKTAVALNSGLSEAEWFDLVTLTLATSFHKDDDVFVKDVQRYDFSVLDTSNVITHGPVDAPVEVLLIVDPVDTQAALWSSIIDSVRDMQFVHTKVILQPQRNLITSLTHAFVSNYPRALVKFDEKGQWMLDASTKMKLPENLIFDADIVVPSRWKVQRGDSNVDLENLVCLSHSYAQFELSELIIEGYARDIHSGRHPLMILSLDNGHDTTVMSALGYFQLPAKPGTTVTMRAINGDLLSAREKFDSNIRPTEVQFEMWDLSAYNVHARTSNEFAWDFQDDGDTINIFSIAGGELYERLMGIMTASVRQHTKRPLKFWLLENFLSEEFKSVTLPALAAYYGYDYELVSYKWPRFLRQQDDKQRQIWGYKILFLDELFPSNVSRIIYVDADQVVRSDLGELMDLDLEGKPYAFTPMCEDREDMKGYMFWKQGYWENILGENLRYHISALFVVDLTRFRALHAGDWLRSHYQKLSSDPNSLANLDQDLPNNLQNVIPIFSLPQEWLWCETWCNLDWKDTAKSIDLCNDPLTKENKLTKAKRLILEWSDYDRQIQTVLSLDAGIGDEL